MATPTYVFQVSVVTDWNIGNGDPVSVLDNQHTGSLFRDMVMPKKVFFNQIVAQKFMIKAAQAWWDEALDCGQLSDWQGSTTNATLLVFPGVYWAEMPTTVPGAYPNDPIPEWSLTIKGLDTGFFVAYYWKTPVVTVA